MLKVSHSQFIFLRYKHPNLWFFFVYKHTETIQYAKKQATFKEKYKLYGNNSRIHQFHANVLRGYRKRLAALGEFKFVCILSAPEIHVLLHKTTIGKIQYFTSLLKFISFCIQNAGK